MKISLILTHFYQRLIDFILCELIKRYRSPKKMCITHMTRVGVRRPKSFWGLFFTLLQSSKQFVNILCCMFTATVSLKGDLHVQNF